MDHHDICAAWLASAMLPPDRLHTLLCAFSSLYDLHDAVLRGEKQILDIIPPEHFQRLRRNATASKMQKWEQLIRAHDIHTLLITDSCFPENLAQISDPPCILFYQGSLKTLTNQRCLAMIGSRRASWAGIRATRTVAEELSRKGVTVVSGFACGIDSAAHEGAVRGGTPTIAIAGCGLDQAYPRENMALKQSILEHNGLFISEYSPGELPLGWHFPIRNRLISGISSALIVMEAKIRSGTLTTVQHALDQGKEEVFVYPGDPESVLYEGNRQLLREGARFFTTASDILEDLKWYHTETRTDQTDRKEPELNGLSASEMKIYHALQGGPLSFDQLYEKTQLPVGELNSLLTMLQLKKLISALPGKFFAINAQKQ